MRRVALSFRYLLKVKRFGSEKGAFVGSVHWKPLTNFHYQVINGAKIDMMIEDNRTKLCSCKNNGYNNNIGYNKNCYNNSYSINFERIRCTSEEGNQDDGDLALAPETSKPQLRRPPMFKVIMFNDDFTPMEFVVEVLEWFFGMNTEKATQVMLQVHTEGRAICGVFTRDIAETKATQVNEYAQENQHPLLCQIEAVESDEE